MICERFDVVIVPFPFTDRAASKRRPAVVLSSATGFNHRAGHSLMAMITSSDHGEWPGDVPLNDLRSAGLPVTCCIRLKLFTLDNRLILRKAGTLGVKDKKALTTSLQRVLSG